MRELAPDAVAAAAERLAERVHRTPIHRSRSLDALAGGELFFKCENLQRTGSFKARGALNAVAALLAAGEPPPAVVTHSSGNHGAALAWAASLHRTAAYVVVPRTAPAVKRRAMEAYGARLHPCEPTQAAREATAAALRRETGAAFVHPFDDARVIAGQGTAVLELLEEVPNLDLILLPVGGGGLLGGSLLAAAAAGGPEIVGVEPRGADDAVRSLAAGRIVAVEAPRTVADGLRMTLGELPFRLAQQHGTRIVTVEDAPILRALRLAFERLKLVVEPSGAVPLAAVLEGAVEARGRRVGIVLSGGNVDLPWPEPS